MGSAPCALRRLRRRYRRSPSARRSHSRPHFRGGIAQLRKPGPVLSRSRHACSCRTEYCWFTISLRAERFRDAPGLDEWFAGFYNRFPPPAQEARELSPEILAQRKSGFRVSSHRQFEIGIPLAPESYLNYVMTETNVAAAVREGAPLSEIRSWCAQTLAPVWQGSERRSAVPRLFRLYDAYCTW